MNNEISKQVEELKNKSSAAADAFGNEVVLLMQNESSLLLHWLKYIIESQQTGTANGLLEGACSSIRETAACVSLGLVRPALFAMRAQVDLILAWLYFKDHPIEWKNVNDHGEGFKMKKDILEYLSNNFKGFSARLTLLKEVATRSTEDPYRLLSAHVHAQSDLVLPAAQNLSDVVEKRELAIECTKVASEACEYISDILMALYATKWTAIPDQIKSTVEERLKLKKGHRDRFFAGI